MDPEYDNTPEATDKPLDNDEITKNITIRGINAEAYNNFSKNIKSLDMNIGEAVSKVMADINQDFDETFPQVSAKTFVTKKKIGINHYAELSVSAQDFMDADAQISFSHIYKLNFEPDVTRELFETHVREISHCDVVRLPAIFPKLLAYSMINFCEKIELYETDNDL